MLNAILTKTEQRFQETGPLCVGWMQGSQEGFLEEGVFQQWLEEPIERRKEGKEKFQAEK